MTVIEVVIAHFSEDLSWLKPLLIEPQSHPHHIRITVYDKQGAPIADDLRALLTASPHRIIPLPNVGRESHSYLTHINSSKNQESVSADVTVFSQGNIADHVPTTKDRITDELFDPRTQAHMYLIDLAEKALRAADGLSPNHAIVNAGNMSAHWHLKLADKWPNLMDTGKNYGEWYERVFERSFPRTPIRWYKNAIFAVTQQAISLVATDVCERLLKEVSSHVDPEAGHFMERSWREMFLD